MCSAARIWCWRYVVAERVAMRPSVVSSETRCIRTRSLPKLRQVSPVAISATRMTSRPSQHSWM
jgi:hypothetical protein